MEPPVAASGPVLRRTATFSHRQERALQDVNGRVSVVNKSQEHLSMVKSTADGQKVARSAKQYSAVASRYAAPLASKKQPPGIGNEPQAGQSNMTKLPFITGRAAPSHQRRSSTDNLSSFNPPMVFSASRRDTRPDSLAKKAMEDSNSLGAKRPRATMRTSLLEKRTQLQARGPRFYSSDRGGCLCSKKGSVRSSVEVSGAGTVSLLYSAAHWLFLIKLAEEEKKHDVVVELFRLALTLKAEPSEDVKVQLKLYHESHPTDELARRLVEECEGVMQVEMACTTVEAGREGQFNSEESNISVTNLARVDTGVSFGLNSGCSDADLGTPCMQSAPSEENLDFTPNGRQAVKEIDVDSLTKKVVSHTVPEGISITVPESSAAQRNVVTFPVPSHGRRKSWQCIGEQSSIPSAEKSNVFHRHTLSADAEFLSVRCNGERSLLSVEEKVKFTDLAEVRGAIPAVSKIPVHGFEGTGANTAVEEFKEAVHMDENSTQLTYWQAAKDDDCEPPVEFVVEMKPNVVITPGTDSRMTASAEIESFSGRNEASESTLVALLPVYSPKMSLKGDTKPLSATPIAVTPCQPASVGNPRARHRRASSVGNLTPGVPFDMSAESSPFGDYVCSPSSQSSSAKSKLTSRGYKEVTPRMNLPKPSWKAIVEREMKGSKLKALLAAQLPKETSPFSEYLEIQMENQSRNAVSGTIWSTEKNVNLTRSPAKREVAPTEGQHETGEVLRSAQVPRKLNEVLLDLHATAGALYCNIAPV